MNNVVVVLQARTTSSRLPGKALLTLAGMPSVVLAAKRSANAGNDVIVATSEEASDKVLVDALQAYDIRSHRGSLDNVQSRLVDAVSDYDNDDWIVRLTGDNSFPDGSFINELADAAKQTGEDYMGTKSPHGGLPYGMAAEIMKIGALRNRVGRACEIEREHVTTYLRQASQAPPFTPAHTLNHGHMRCTLDTIDDFLRLHAIYKNIPNPIDMPWMELCAHLAALPEFQPVAKPFLGAKMTFGTVQLGVENYGRSNTAGKPDDTQAKALIHAAVDSRIIKFDTARAYGDSEQRLAKILGKNLLEKCEVYTKLSPLSKLPAEATEAEVNAFVDASVYESCHHLKQSKLHTLLLHRWAHYGDHNGAIWARLLALQDQGLIGRLGVSISSPTELLEALKVPQIQKVQLPMNILDHRWFTPELQLALQGRTDVEIEVRSVYLQGILLNDASVWPSKNGLEPQSFIDKIESLVTETNSQSKADLCVSYIRSIPWVDRIVVGMETLEQLRLNVELFTKPLLTDSQIDSVRSTLGEAPGWLLDPSTWNT